MLSLKTAAAAAGLQSSSRLSMTMGSLILSPSLSNPLFYYSQLLPATAAHTSTTVAMRGYHAKINRKGNANSRENRMKQIYTCVPASFETKRNDPFNYRLRSMAEIKKQLEYFTPDLYVSSAYKRYTAGDYRQEQPNNTDDRDRVSKLRFDLSHLKLFPLQRERFLFLLGPRVNSKNPNSIKIVTKQYPTFVENYFKGMETIQELYYEALRAPEDAVNLRRDPYIREKFIKKKFGRTKSERMETIKMLKRDFRSERSQLDAEKMEEVKAKEELSKKRTENIKIRRRLGFIDLQADENGNLVEIPDEQGVDDELMDKLNLKKARWEKTVEEERERKPMQIVTPISGISKDEYKDGMLRSDEYFKDQ